MWSLDPTGTTVRPGERIACRLTWTVPAPRGWRSLDTLQLRLVDGGETALWVRFDEVAGTPGLFSVVNSTNAKVGPGFAPGRHNRLEGELASVDLAESAVDGAPGRRVTLTLALGFKPLAAGHTYDVLVAATDDAGEVQGFHRAGTITVNR